jgi:uncharacterized membrane protein YcaP (DUF421 family)
VRLITDITAIFLRAIIAFTSLLIFCRILGKTQIAQMTFFEYVAGITIGALASELTTNVTVRPIALYVGLATWCALVLALQFVSLKSRWMSKMTEGEPVIVIQNGQIMENALRKMRLQVSELTPMLRDKGVFDLTTVEFAVVEPQGTLSVLLRSQEQPVTPKDMGISTQYEGLGVELVVDGAVMEQNLRRLRLNRAWLTEQLRLQNVTSPDEVFLAVMDTQGKLYIDRYTDRSVNVHDMSDFPGPN